jgi:uncharacterized protein
MAFSNYLGTSILMMFVFQGWALGLFGQLHRPGLMLIVFAVWTGNAAVVEAVARPLPLRPARVALALLTYWHLFPFRR